MTTVAPPPDKTATGAAAPIAALATASATATMDTPAPTPTPRVPIPPRGVDYRGKLVLAPMVRSGELPSRLTALHYGADLVWGPETVDHSMIGTTRRVNPRTGMIEWTRIPTNNKKVDSTVESVIFRIDPVREASRLIFQLGTSDPARAVEAARLVAPDCVGIDVNAGCPKPFSTSGGMGAALLKTPDKLVAILEALVRDVAPAAQIGISVKIRILETPAETEVLVRRLVATGITGLTLHCRTPDMRKTARAIRGQVRMVADVCREAGVAFLLNGDVETRSHAAELAYEFGTDGAMIATAAESNPSCFRSNAAGGLASWEEVVGKYLTYAIEVENKLQNTKYLLAQMVPGKAGIHPKLHGCKSYRHIIELLGCTDLVDRAAAVDAVLNLPPPVAPPPQLAAAKPSGTKRKRGAAAGASHDKKKKTVPSAQAKPPRSRSASPAREAIEAAVGAAAAVAPQPVAASSVAV